MAIKLGINDKAMDSNAQFTYSSVASGILNAFTFDSPQAREMKRRERVRCDLVKAQFGKRVKNEAPPLIERLGQLLQLD